MGEKKKIQNKSEKKAAPKTKSIDWAKVESQVIVVALKGNTLVEGKEYPVTKEIAKILVDSKKATLA
jgi:hypothetical protein